jgi:archaemetzincin
MLPILLVPVGAVDPAILRWLTLALPDSLGLPCAVAPSPLDPTEAYDTIRRQYYSTRILGRLAAMDGTAATKVLGIAEVDLFIPILTFVFGEAQLGKQAALISTHRLRQSFYGLPDDEKLYFERIEKEAIHELGHAFGMVHCRRYDCVMSFSNSIERVDLKQNAFCSDCAALLPAG